MSPQFGDMDDDVTLRARARRAEDRRGPELDEAPADREVTLNTGTVLALFFTLALICAVFFGFGYSMGRKSAAQTTATTAPDSSPAPAATVESASIKPTPGAPAIPSVPGYESQSEANESSSKSVAQSTRTPASAAVAATSSASSTQPKKPATETTPDTPAPVVRTAPAAATPAATSNAVSTAPVPGATYVQIAAVSHKEDADVLLSALQRRGYKVLTRSDVGDRLIHVQIGPFSDRKQAEATRQKLLSDGYNAFLK